MASHLSYNPALAPRAAARGPSAFHEVWEKNFEEEFEALLSAVTKGGGPEATIAMDMEFPGFPRNDPQFSSPALHHQALCCNVDQLWPIQLGVAVVGQNGTHHGVWTFNLRFDPEIDAHTPESLTFLRRAGLDFVRHRTDGIDALVLGRKLANSTLIGPRAPCWLTFSGAYDWGYLLKLVRLGRALPSPASTYNQVLAAYCPRRQELRDWLPEGSLEALGRRHGVKRYGSAHTAGSDALLTLELHILFTQEQMLSDLSWQHEEGWSSDGSDGWYSRGNAAAWSSDGDSEWHPGNAAWAPQRQHMTSWHYPSEELFHDPAWYSPNYQQWLVAQ